MLYPLQGKCQLSYKFNATNINHDTNYLTIYRVIVKTNTSVLSQTEV